MTVMRTNLLGRSGGWLLGWITPGRLALIGLAVGAAVPPAWLLGRPSFSPFMLSTGLPDPVCGITRSVVTLLHGDLAASLYFHPLGPAVVAALLALALVELIPRRVWAGFTWTGAGDSSPSTALVRRLAETPLPLIGAVAFLLVWLIRLPLFFAGVWVY